MKTEKVICASCRKKVDFIVREGDDIAHIKDSKGKTYHIPYIRKYAYCKECGNEVYVPEVEDYNAKAPVNNLYGKRDDKHSLFTLPMGHVVYVVGVGENNLFDWHEEHVDTTEVQMSLNYNKIIIHTQEGHERTFEVDAFLTIEGAMEGVRNREISYARMIERSKSKK